MKPTLRCWLLVGALVVPAVTFAGEPKAPRAASTKAAQSRELWMKKQPGFAPEKQQVFDLAKAYEASSSPAEQVKIRALLREQIENYYTLRERSRQETIRRLEDQLAELKKNEEKQKPRRQATIDDWVKQLTVEAK
ncbi:MAG: hypothetical protein NTV49_00890 [Kiritimatiellaeota bacterium]|nr:hypothetical protein [Kiritimatiellota bacterium]